MKVKIGNKTYTTKDGPIMVILADKDKENIASMRPKDTKYCQFEDEDAENINEFMEI